MYVVIYLLSLMVASGQWCLTLTLASALILWNFPVLRNKPAHGLQCSEEVLFQVESVTVIIKKENTFFSYKAHQY